MSNHELAQLNVARLVAPIDSPQLADFVANLDRINALADNAPGFVWRLQTEDGDATAIRHFGDEFIVNMSVWRDTESLRDYVYRSAHLDVMRRKKEWFEKMREAHMVLWWVPAGHRPSLDEADARLQQLRENGPSEHAFLFNKPFPAPGAAAQTPLPASELACPAS